MRLGISTDTGHHVVIAGLDPQSIVFAKSFHEMMDPRVKPAGDGWGLNVGAAHSV